MNIVFAFHCEPGHTNPSFGVARRLRDRGHRVVYMGLMESRGRVIEQGFEFVPIEEDVLPEAPKESMPEAPGSRLFPGWLQRRFAAERSFASFLRSFSNGHLDTRLRSCEPDLLVCDTMIWYIALRAIFLGIPTVNVCIPLTGQPNPYIPPCTGSRIPRSSSWGRMQVRADWLWLRCRFVITKRLASMLLGTYRSPTRMHHLTDEFFRLARLSGIRCREDRDYYFTEYGPRLLLPEISCCPRPFDFPHPPHAGRRYACALIDEARWEDASPLEKLAPEKPLVYCSLGSAAQHYPHAAHFYRTVVAASRQRQDWQWLLSVGTWPEPDVLRETGANLMVVKWAPQLSVLKRAAAMVTHGGINSIMECIHFITPMVIVPGARDQPGCMARAVYHGIALAANMKDLSPDQLLMLIENAMHSPDLQQALSRMKQRIASESSWEAAVDFIEQTGRAGQSGNPPNPPTGKCLP